MSDCSNDQITAYFDDGIPACQNYEIPAFFDKELSDYLDKQMSAHSEKKRQNYSEDEILAFDDLEEKRKEFGEAKAELQAASKNYGRVRRNANLNKLGVDYSLTKSDVEYVVKYLFKNTPSITQLFEECEVALKKQKGWGAWAKRKTFRQSQVKGVLFSMEKEGDKNVELMKKYELFDNKNWLSTGEIGSVLNRLKFQFCLAKRFAKKDKKIADLEEEVREQKKIEDGFKARLMNIEFIRKRQKVLLLHTFIPELNYTQLSTLCDVSRPTASKYCREYRLNE